MNRYALGGFFAALVILALLAVFCSGPAAGHDGYEPTYGPTYKGEDTYGQHGNAPLGDGWWPGGKLYAVALTVDDSADDIVSFAVLAAAQGVPLTYYTKQELLGEANMATYGQMALVAASYPTNEYSTTGRMSNNPAGILRYADGDSVKWDADPSWPDSAWSTGGNVTTYGVDIGPWTYAVADSLRSLGYYAARSIYHDNATGGHRPTHSYSHFPGAGPWDKAALLPTDAPGCLMGFASFRATDEDSTIAVLNLHTHTPVADIGARMRTNLLAVSAANGYAPIALVFHDTIGTGTWETSVLIDSLQATGQVWFATVDEIADYYMGKMVPVDAPGLFPYAQLEGVTAADSIFWAPELIPTEYVCSTDLLCFSDNSTSATGTYDGHYTDGMTAGLVIYNDQVTPVASTGNLTYPTQEFPLSGSEGVLLAYYNITELAGKSVTLAEVNNYNIFGDDWSDAADEDAIFHAIIGVTNTGILAGHGSVNGVCYDYVDAAPASTAWTFGTWDAITELSDIGDYIHAENNYPGASWVTTDVTAYIQWAVANGVEDICFAYTGNYEKTPAGTWTFRSRSHGYSTPSSRPYLEVEVCE